MRDQESCSEIETLIRREFQIGRLSLKRLRQFACVSGKRALEFYDDPIMHKVLQFAQKRASFPISSHELQSLRTQYGDAYDELYSGYGSPSPEVLAMSAAGEAAFTDDPISAAINTVRTIADAKGTAAGDGDPDHFDVAYRHAYAKECSEQLDLLRTMLTA